MLGAAGRGGPEEGRRHLALSPAPQGCVKGIQPPPSAPRGPVSLPAPTLTPLSPGALGEEQGLLQSVHVHACVRACVCITDACRHREQGGLEKGAPLGSWEEEGWWRRQGCAGPAGEPGQWASASGHRAQGARPRNRGGWRRGEGDRKLKGIPAAAAP